MLRRFFWWREGHSRVCHPTTNVWLFFNRQGDSLGLNGFDINAGLPPNNRSIVFTTSGNDARDSPPSWSPDAGAPGARLVFASIRETDARTRVYVKDAGTGDNATSLGLGQDPAWHPSADNVIVHSGRDPAGSQPGLWLIDDAGRMIRQLTAQERDRRPTWSPDGSFIIFMSDGRDGNWELYRLQVESGQVSRLTENPAQDGLPTISPDGRYVAYVNDQEGVWNLWVAPLAPQEDGGAILDPAVQLNLEIEGAPVAPIEGSLTSWLEHAIQWVAN
jgi:Tol biopolymer transport system component